MTAGVLIAGGVRGSETPVNSADIYDPIDDSWTPIAGMARARYGISAVMLGNGKVLVPGGLNYDPATPPEQALSSAELYTE